MDSVTAADTVHKGKSLANVDSTNFRTTEGKRMTRCQQLATRQMRQKSPLPADDHGETCDIPSTDKLQLSRVLCGDGEASFDCLFTIPQATSSGSSSSHSGQPVHLMDLVFASPSLSLSLSLVVYRSLRPSISIWKMVYTNR